MRCDPTRRSTIQRGRVVHSGRVPERFRQDDKTAVSTRGGCQHRRRPTVTRLIIMGGSPALSVEKAELPRIL